MVSHGVQVLIWSIHSMFPQLQIPSFFRVKPWDGVSQEYQKKEKDQQKNNGWVFGAFGGRSTSLPLPPSIKPPLIWANALILHFFYPEAPIGFGLWTTRPRSIGHPGNRWLGPGLKTRLFEGPKSIELEPLGNVFFEQPGLSW